MLVILNSSIRRNDGLSRHRQQPDSWDNRSLRRGGGIGKQIGREGV
jgi:hypothetical protein